MQPLKKYCDSKYCYYNTPRSIQEVDTSKLENIICPMCIKVVYCSQRCRERDWTQGHKTTCTSQNLVNQGSCQSAPRSRSLNDTYDSASTLKAMRRKPEEFEVINRGGKTDLGKGSYGSVKLVKDKQNGKEFAMKIVHLQIFDIKMLKRQIFEYCSVENLKREIKIQRKLQHPHITKLHHYFEDKEAVYLILEYAENGSLFSYLRKRKRLSEREAFVYFFQTCLGTDYLHKNNIIHRDLKPENLLLDKEGNIKMCDFGWSAENMTQSQKRNTFCGTCEYMAPEMIKNLPHDQSLDVWSLGILLYELLHGNAPFRGKNDHEVCENILEFKPIHFDASISSDAQALILSILKYNPTERASLRQIFDHPWMVRISRDYQIDIWQFVYQPSQPFRKTPVLSASQQMQKPQDTPTIQPSNQQPMKRPEPPLPQKKYSDVSTKYTAGSPNDIIRVNRQYDAKPQQRAMPPMQFETDQQKTRVSRVSTRNEIMQHTKENQLIMQRQQDQDITFMDRVFMAFGCLKRDKNNANI